MRAKDINTGEHARGKRSAGILLLLQKCRQMKSAGPQMKNRMENAKREHFSGREHNNSSLRGAASLRSTASSSAIFTVYRMREISRRCFV